MKNKFRFRLGQEFRANAPDENGCSWGRAKRANVVKTVLTDWDTRDRHYPHDKKSWKRKRDKQYHVDGRPRKHSCVLPGDQVRTWLLQKYFEKYGIAFRITPRREKRTSFYWVREERKACHRVPVYHYRFVDGVYKPVHRMGFRTEYYWVPLETPIRKEREHYVTVEYKVTWWSNHPIDIEKILASMP